MVHKRLMVLEVPLLEDKSLRSTSFHFSQFKISLFSLSNFQNFIAHCYLLLCLALLSFVLQFDCVLCCYLSFYKFTNFLELHHIFVLRFQILLHSCFLNLFCCQICFFSLSLFSQLWCSGFASS